MAHRARHRHAHLDARRAGNRAPHARRARDQRRAAGGDGGRRDPDRLARAACRRRATCSPTSARSRSRSWPRGWPRVAPTRARTYGLQRSEVLGALLNGIALVVDLGADRGRGDRAPLRSARRGGRRRAGAGLVGPRRQRRGDVWCWPPASGRTSTSRACFATRPADALSSLGRGRRRGASCWRPAGTRRTRSPASLIAALIAASSWRLLKEPLDVLLEAAPAGHRRARGRGRDGRATRDVVEVHDLHVWTVTSGFPGASAHIVVVPPGATATPCARRLERLLDERFEHPPHDASGGARSRRPASSCRWSGPRLAVSRKPGNKGPPSLSMRLVGPR